MQAPSVGFNPRRLFERALERARFFNFRTDGVKIVGGGDYRK